MSSRKPSRRQLLSSCADLGPDDGVDPRTLFRKPSGRVSNRKALQLCGQVGRTLNEVLAACGDDSLRELIVASVRPAPTSARLLVTVCPAVRGPIDPSLVLERLQRASGLLRREVAAAIHRRKTPELTFRVAAADDMSD